MSPDTQQNILYTIYFLLLHNFLAIAFFGGVILSVAWAIYRPSRHAIFFIIGFGLLLFAFEYQKHIADALVQQTQNSLITERQSFRIARIVHIVLGRLVTPGSAAAGLGFLGLGVITALKSKNKQHHHHSSSHHTKEQEVV